MICRLETFGGLSLGDADGKERSVQRRRLAVLALLATAQERGLSRDQLVAYLWSEATDESARHSLEQVLYGLRRSINDELFLGVNPIRLNPAVIEVSAARFEAALASGAIQDAVALYRGPFLDGFYLNDAPEFERWAASERSRLAGRYAGAVGRLAETAETERAFNVAVEWRRTLASLDPLSAPRALGLMRALAGAGDTAGALSHARTYESLLRIELEASPDSSITAYVRGLREAAATETIREETRKNSALAQLPARTIPANAHSSVTDAAAIGVDVPHVAAVASPEPNGAPGVRFGSTAESPAAGRLRSTAVLAGVAVCLVVFGILAWRFPTVFRRDRVPDETRVAVFPARVIGPDSTIANAAEGIMDLLAAALTGDGMPAAVDSRATMSAWRRATESSEKPFTIDDAREVGRRVNAGSVLLTDVSWLGAGQLRLRTRLVAVFDGAERAHAEQHGPVDSLTGMVDALLAEMLVRQTGDEHLRLATLTSRSLPAVAEFLQGRADYRRGHSATAIAHFERALALDSSFALAALELVSAHRWTLRWTTRAIDTVAQTMPLDPSARLVPTASARNRWQHGLHVAWTGRDRLSARDRALLAAVAGPRFPSDSYAREFLIAWDDAVRAAPERPEGLYELGNLLLHQGAVVGLTAPLARAAASFNRALEFDPSFVSPLAGLLELAALDHNLAEARRLGTLYLARDSVGAQADYVKWRVASLSGDATTLRALRSQFTSLDLETLARIQTTSQVAGVSVDDADLANDAILRRVSEGTQRQIALHNAFWLALNRGRPGVALDILAQKRDVDPNDDLRLAHTLRGALFGDGDVAAGTESARTLERRVGWPLRFAGSAPLTSPRMIQGIFSVALWRLWHDDTTGATEAIRQLRSGDARSVPHGGAELLEALLASRTRRPDLTLVLQRLDSIAMLGCCTLPHFINFGSARVHERAGDLRGALAAIRRGRWLLPPEYLSAYLREEGRLADLTGDRAGAIRAYRHYLVLRAEAETVLRPQVDSIRRELKRLEATP